MFDSIAKRCLNCQRLIQSYSDSCLVVFHVWNFKTLFIQFITILSSIYNYFSAFFSAEMKITWHYAISYKPVWPFIKLTLCFHESGISKREWRALSHSFIVNMNLSPQFCSTFELSIKETSTKDNVKRNMAVSCENSEKCGAFRFVSQTRFSYSFVVVGKRNIPPCSLILITSWNTLSYVWETTGRVFCDVVWST